MGYWPRETDPVSFNEKILSQKIACYRATNTCSLQTFPDDKLRSRAYVLSKIPHIMLPLLYHVTKDPGKIPFEELPQNFVIKSNYSYGSIHVIVVRDLSKADRTTIVTHCKKWLSPAEIAKFAYVDPRLRSLTPCILIEEYLEDMIYSVPMDYKYFVFNGHVEFVEIYCGDLNKELASNSYGGKFCGAHFVNTYDRDWKEVDFSRGALRQKLDVEKPDKLSEMLAIAECIGKDFPFCRVDLYNINGKGIIFGELGVWVGARPFVPYKYDELFGSYI
jgi:hypothetical protein